MEIIYYGKKKKEFQKNFVKINYINEKNKKISYVINKFEEIDSYEKFKKLNNINDSLFEKLKFKGNKVKIIDFPIRRRYNIINITLQDFCEISKIKNNKNIDSNYNSYSLIKFIDIQKANKYLFKIQKNQTINRLDNETEAFLQKIYDIYNKFVSSKESIFSFYNDCQKYKSEFDEKSDKLRKYFLSQKTKNVYYNEKPYLKNKIEEQKFENKYISYSILLILFSSDEINFTKFFLGFKTILQKKNVYYLLDRINIILTYTLIYYNTKDIALIFNLKDYKNKLLIIKSENFFRDIIKNLEEYSALFFLYLQLNSGSGENLYDNKTYYKISMIELNDIKFHLLKLFPKYFFIVSNSQLSDIALTCYPTNVETFNINNFFTSNIINNKDIENSSMSFSLIKFHETGHEKFSLNSNGCDSPRHFFSSEFYPFEQTTWEEDREKFFKQYYVNYNLFKENKNNFYIYKGESGKCVDFYLFDNYIYLSNLIFFDNLKDIKDIKLFISPSLEELHEKIKEILKMQNSNKSKFENIEIGTNQLRNTGFNFKIDVF